MQIKIPNYSSNAKHIIKIDKWDSWNCDKTISMVVFPILLQLKENKQGVPAEFGDVGGADYDEQESFDFYKDTHSEAWELGIKRWDTILDKIIWSFYQLGYSDELETKYNIGESDYEFTDGTLLQRNPDYWYDSLGEELHQKRIQEGLDLFGKYFQSLWD